MKTRYLALILFNLSHLSALATENQPAPCHCQAKKDADSANDKPLSSESVFQLSSTWTDANGAPFSLSSLRGSPVVIAMIFTSCPGACPLIVSDIKRIESGLSSELRAKAKFVLVSFDPETDTVAALRKFKSAQGINGKNWTLITGSKDSIRDLAAALGIKYKQMGPANFSHSNVISILDAEGVISHQQIGLRQDPASSIEKLSSLFAPSTNQGAST